MARKFFYVCAGLFLLALVFHLGQSSARAQSGVLIEGAAMDMEQNPFTFPPRASGVVGRTFYLFYHDGAVGPQGAPVPGTEPVIATEPNFERVMLANGDIYQMSGSSWTFIGNLLGTPPTAALRQSWGQLKSRYHAAPTVTPGMTVTPGANDR